MPLRKAREEKTVPNPEYLRDRDTGDEYQRVHGNTYRRTSMGGGSCSLGCLVLLVLVICGSINYLGVSFDNYRQYHVFTYSYTDALTAQAATVSAAPTVPVATKSPAHKTISKGGKAQVDVQANSDWQDSGIPVLKGKVVHIEYVSGAWRPWPGVDFNAEGCTQGCDSTTNNLIVGCNHGGLIGRIGSQMICVLKGATVTATDSGNLSLRINDQQTSDDSGFITVKITVT